MSDNYISQLRAGEIGLLEVPKAAKTHAICLAAVNRNGLDIYHVPTHFRSETVIWAAVYQNPAAIQYVDKAFLLQNPELVKIAASRKADSLKIIQKHCPELISYAIYLSAVRASGANIRLVPDEFITEELLLIAAENDPSALGGIRFFSNQKLAELIKSVVPKISLKYLPDHYKTYEICLNQVSKQGRLLKYVPDAYVDENMVEAAISSNGWAIEYVPLTFSDLSCVNELIVSGNIPKQLYSHIESGLLYA